MNTPPRLSSEKSTFLPSNHRSQKAREIWKKNEPYLNAEFFIGGFLFDILTLQRIDDWLNIIQQFLFISVVLVLLILKTKNWSPPEKWPSMMKKAWSYELEALHFLFGSLLSGFMVFYFKSSSIFVSFGFMIFLAALMVANEFKKFKEMELSFKWALFSVCLISYFSYLVPIVLGFIGVGPFLLSLCITAIIIWFIFFSLKKIVPKESHLQLKKKLLLPSIITLLVFATAYWLQLIPPVPLSLKYIGIYHQVQKTSDGKYELSHQRPWWKFWHKGDQYFLAAPGDKIFCYFRLFSPTNFKDEIRLHWLKKDAKRGWESQDQIAIKVFGGREEGFRGFGAKSNYTTGSWRVQVETTEGREIGRLYFNVVSSNDDNSRLEQTQRSFQIDRE